MGGSARSSRARPGCVTDKERAFARFDRTDPRQRVGACGRRDSLPPASARLPSEASLLAKLGSGVACRVDGHHVAAWALSSQPTSGTAGAADGPVVSRYNVVCLDTTRSGSRLPPWIVAGRCCVLCLWQTCDLAAPSLRAQATVDLCVFRIIYVLEACNSNDSFTRQATCLVRELLAPSTYCNVRRVSYYIQLYSCTYSTRLDFLQCTTGDHSTITAV